MAAADVTNLLIDWNQGDESALDRLIPVVYDELRRLAARCMSQEGPGHTLQSTAVVHEAYLKLIDQQRVHWQNRAQFFAVAEGCGPARIWYEKLRKYEAAQKAPVAEAEQRIASCANAH